MRLAVALALVVLTAAVAAQSAAAAVTLGQAFTPTAQTSATIVQTGVTDGQGYTVPSNGVITSWSFQSETAPATVRLKVARANANGTYTIVGESDPQTTTPNALQTFATRVPVRAGDVIGTAGTDGKTVAYTGASGDTIALSPGDQPAGSTGNYTAVQGIRVDVTASIEPDVDGDGFGDETQDFCPSDPTSQVRCSADLRLSAAVDQRIVHPGGQVTFKLTVTNGGPSMAAGVKLVAQLSDELKLVGTDGGTCSGSPITCTLGDLSGGQQATVTVVADAVSTGMGSIAARATSGTNDPNLAGNAAGQTVHVTWRPGNCANVFSAGTGNDVKRGTRAGDRIDGLLGNDVLEGLAGADCLSGGLGNDRLMGDDGNDRLDGGPGNDTIQGGSGNDRIDGGPGNDRISGGSGADTINGDGGNDQINAADGSRDTVDCGPGKDAVTADRRDRVRHCEKVVYAKRR